MRARLPACLVLALSSGVIVSAISAGASGPPPVAHDLSVQVAENGTISYYLPIDDPSRSEVVFNVVSPPAHGTLVLGGDGVDIGQTYTPATGYTGPDTYTYSVRPDGGGDPISTATVSIDVEPNALPGTGESVAAGQPFSFTVGATGGTVTSPTAGGDSVVIDASPASPPNAVALTAIDVSAPPATTTAPDTVALSFTDGALTADTDHEQWSVWHNGVSVPDCTDSNGAAAPDPCISSRANPNYNSLLVITILTSQTGPGSWVLGLDDVAPTLAIAPFAYISGGPAVVVQGREQEAYPVFNPREAADTSTQVTYTDISTSPPTLLTNVPGTNDVRLDTLPAGLHTIVASSTAALNVSAATSPAYSFWVNPFSVVIAQNPAQLSATPGVTYVERQIKLYLQEGYAYKGPVTAKVVGGSLPPGVKMSAAGYFSGIPTSAGVFPVTFQVTDSSTPAKVAVVPTEMTVEPMDINVYTTPTTVIETAMSDHLTVLGGLAPFHWAMTSGALPPGLKFSSGVISGTPTALGSYTFSLAVTDSEKPVANHATATFTMTVVPITVEEPHLPTVVVGKAYPSVTVKTDGGKSPFKWTVTAGALPSGMKLSTSGTISGTPTQSGTFTFTVTATDSAKPADSANQTLQIVIAPLVITNPSGYHLYLGKHFSATLTTNGGVGTRTWSIVSGQLPPGISLSPTGTVGGTPTYLGNYPVTFAVHDSAHPANTATKTIDFYV